MSRLDIQAKRDKVGGEDKGMPPFGAASIEIKQ